MTYYEKMMAEQSALSLSRLGFDTTKVAQGTPEWHRSRLGVITASRASDLIAEGKLAPMPADIEIVKIGRENIVNFNGKEFTGTKADCTAWVREQLPRIPAMARHNYLCELIAEITTGQVREQGQFKQAEWGHEYENSARQIFAFHMGIPCQEVTFIYGNESMRYGCSPDGISDDHSGTEIKCPFTSSVYIDFSIFENIKPEYIDQVQFSMFVTGLPYWHFCNYDPRQKVNSFHAITIERDEAKMRQFEDAVGEMSHAIDKALAKVGMRFGDQWLPEKEAA